MKWDNAFTNERYNIPNIPGIYAILSPSGKYYIGSAINLKERLRSHSKKLKSLKHENPFLLNSYQKYKKLVFLPLKLLKFVGLNREQISVLLSIEEQKFLELCETDERCMNMNFKAIRPPDCSIEIISIDRNGNKKEFSSLINAASYYDILNQNVCAVLKGRAKTSGGVTFFYKNQSHFKWELRFENKTQKRTIKSISISGEVSVFPSINEAARTLGLHNQSIGKVLLGKMKHTNGYKFLYE